MRFLRFVFSHLDMMIGSFGHTNAWMWSGSQRHGGYVHVRRCPSVSLNLSIHTSRYSLRPSRVGGPQPRGVDRKPRVLEFWLQSVLFKTNPFIKLNRISTGAWLLNLASYSQGTPRELNLDGEGSVSLTVQAEYNHEGYRRALPCEDMFGWNCKAGCSPVHLHIQSRRDVLDHCARCGLRLVTRGSRPKGEGAWTSTSGDYTFYYKQIAPTRIGGKTR